MHVLWPIFHFKLNGVGYKNIKNGLGHFVLHKMGIKSMQLVTASLMALRDLELLKIEFENLTSSILNSFFL